MEYTKGEWKVEVNPTDTETMIATETQNIAKMCYDDAHTLAANAQLIVAAPLLYRACVEAEMLIVDKDAKAQSVKYLLQKALAKAEGK